MSNVREKLKNSQRTGGGKFPKMEINTYLDLKEIEEGKDKGKIAFRYWDKDKEENVYITTPVTGVFIGNAFKCQAFDDTFGKHGANYISAPYLRNDNITIFSPGKNREKFTGSKEEVIAWLAKQGVADKLSVKYCIYIAIEKQLIEVVSNTILSIDQFNSLDEDALTERMVTLTPCLYDKDDISISKQSHERLGKFGSKNPPKYVTIKIGEYIPEEFIEMSNLEEKIDMYLAWKKFKLEGGRDNETTEKKEEQPPLSYNSPDTDSSLPDDLPF